MINQLDHNSAASSFKAANEDSDHILYKEEVLLKQICNCKGSLKYVHESCLIQWLRTKNTKSCELCMRDYDISYEFGSASEILLRGLKYAFKDKRRLLRGLLYALYLWIFFRRFIHMIKSSLKFTRRLFVKSLYNLQQNQRQSQAGQNLIGSLFSQP